MQQNTINMQANNELAKPFAANADNPYDTRSHKDSLELEYYQPKANAPQPQVIIIEDDSQNVSEGKLRSGRLTGCASGRTRCRAGRE